MATKGETDGVVAVVTGAGSGIGRAVARALLRDGHRVVACGRRRPPLQETLGAIGAEQGLAVTADVTEEAQVEALFDAAREAFGRVDFLFNNAGLFGPTRAVGEYPREAWDEVVATNLTGMFLCARAAFQAMAAQDPRGGRIVNNGSISATYPRPGAIAYTTTKHGVTGLTKALALEGRELGIACGQIDIGNADTELTRTLAAGRPAGSPEEPRFDVGHVADAVAAMAALPLDANPLFTTMMATRMPALGRG
jgi:NAD(P)-dependent dehydrogenase (short-subunit alcohol dehydrogenase family)